ncbi:5'-3' exonuclease (including N-terminal domain of PolI) [Mycobacteroides abscessus subsp. abscessus]|nr:5'-3' exonuclease (including N-terminal domain of PolI) [Mycobacteroides abscessus subsp. abscessus]
MPDRLTPQVDMILDVLAAAGIATGGAAGLEADDVLGTLADRERDDDVVVVSGDRDLLQLVRDDPAPPVRVFYAGRGLAKAELFGPAEVSAKYGVPLENAGPAYADMATLRGDASDGLPGVPGIGDKSAATLISRFGCRTGGARGARRHRRPVASRHPAHRAGRPRPPARTRHALQRREPGPAADQGHGRTAGVRPGDTARTTEPADA